MRKVAQLGSVVLMVLALSACGGGGDESAQAPDAASTDAQPKPAATGDEPAAAPTDAVADSEPTASESNRDEAAVPAGPAAGDTATGESATTGSEPTGDGEAVAEPAADDDAEGGYTMRRRLMDSTMGADEWSPDLTGAPLVDVEATLQRAAEALRAGRLDQTENSALVLYQRVLEGDPENEVAIKGVDDVVAALLVRADESFVQARFNEAARILSVVSKLRPDDPGIPLLKAKLDSGREVGMLLAEAQRLTDAGKLIEPPGENAAEIYRLVLSREPQNVAAQTGLARVEAELVGRASRAAETGDYSESERLLAEAGKASPESDAVQDASARIESMREQRAKELMQQAEAALTANQLDEAGSLLDQVVAIAAQTSGVEDLRNRIRNASSYANLRPGESVSDEMRSGGTAPELVVIPLGTFQMGSPDDESDRKSNEGPRHAVTLAKAFAMARAEVTVAQFRRFVDATGYSPTSSQVGTSTIYDEQAGTMAAKSGVNWQKGYSGRNAEPTAPVIHVSWTDAKSYADWVSRETGKPYRLPSEAEFEYVMRAGSNARFPWGDSNPTRLVGNLTGDGDRSESRRNWVNAFPDYNDGYWGPAPVRSYEANRFGIHDTNGNVSEWVEDCWHDTYSRAPADGSPWVNPGCNRRVIRGASWASSPEQARTAFRLTAAPNTTNARLGFRVVREL